MCVESCESKDAERIIGGGKEGRDIQSVPHWPCDLGSYSTG